MTDRIARSHLLADDLARLFAGLPAVETVALGGSRRTDVADALSDFDLYVTHGPRFPLRRGVGADYARPHTPPQSKMYEVMVV